MVRAGGIGRCSICFFCILASNPSFLFSFLGFFFFWLNLEVQHCVGEFRAIFLHWFRYKRRPSFFPLGCFGLVGGQGAA